MQGLFRNTLSVQPSFIPAGRTELPRFHVTKSQRKPHQINRQFLAGKLCLLRCYHLSAIANEQLMSVQTCSNDTAANLRAETNQPASIYTGRSYPTTNECAAINSHGCDKEYVALNVIHLDSAMPCSWDTAKRSHSSV